MAPPAYEDSLQPRERSISLPTEPGYIPESLPPATRTPMPFNRRMQRMHSELLPERHGNDLLTSTPEEIGVAGRYFFSNTETPNLRP